MLHRNNKIILGIVLLILAISERLWFDLGQNVELVTMTAFVATFYLGKRWGIILPLLVLGITDLALGNTSIALFTWSAYACIGLTAVFFGGRTHTSTGRVAGSFAGGMTAAIWFFIWTNFGVWLLDGWEMYSNDAAGLIASYINGLPFLRNQFIGNMIFVPMGVAAIEASMHFIRSLNHQKFIPHIERRPSGHTS